MFTHERHRERQRHRQRRSRGVCGEPDVGLDPRTPGSHPELKAAAQPPSHPDVPVKRILTQCYLVVSRYFQEGKTARKI